MKIRFEPGKVIALGQLSDPDDIMFLLMPYGINEQHNTYLCKGAPSNDYKHIDEVHMCYDPNIVLSRQQRLAIMTNLKLFMK